MIINETTERNDSNNWVKNQLLNDDFKIIEFEGYTIKDNKVTGLFDRRLFKNIELENQTDNEILELVKKEEPLLSSKIAFANIINVFYRYVLYRYEPENVYIYRFEDNTLVFKSKFDNFCDFINQTRKIRDLQMLSPLQENNMPNIDHIFRNRCRYAWMGNLDGLFLSNKNGKPKALIEFQTTIKTPVKEHCNNTWFAPRNGRKGDEQRWKVFDILAKQSNLPLIIIVWSPNEINGDIKYKVVKEIIYSDDKENRKAGLIYSEKIVITYNQLLEKLNILINNE